MDINQYISSGIIEMYVMGLCAPEEKAELELLRTQYPQLETAINEFEVSFEKNALLAASATTQQMDAVILNALQNPVQSVVLMPVQAAVKKINWLKPLTAAAVLLLAASSIFNYTLFKKTEEQQLALNKNITVPLPASLPQSDYNILKSRTITPVAMYGVGYHSICRCTMFWDKNTGKMYMMIHHLASPGSQKKYQLWAMVNNKPVNIGFVDDSIRDRFIEMQNVPADAKSFIVTLENAAGSKTPTLEETYLSGSI